MNRSHQIEKEIDKAVKQYFKHCTHHQGVLYQEMIQQVEKALLKSVLQYTEDNQSQCAKVLGLSRTTLLKKLKQYDLHLPKKES